jgi:hypothetical protein
MSTKPKDAEIVRDPEADEAAMDTYIARNKDALNASIDKATAEYARGEYFSLDQVMADIRAQQQRRRKV